MCDSSTVLLLQQLSETGLLDAEVSKSALIQWKMHKFKMKLYILNFISSAELCNFVNILGENS